jgi:signal transduction histidine kinase
MILSNLVDNAIKHSPAGGEVVVEIARDRGETGLVRLAVTDQGPGIPPDERQRVFERFYRADSTQPGVGLGLSIVAEAVGQVGGSIALDTADSGRGLRAVIRLHAA